MSWDARIFLLRNDLSVLKKNPSFSIIALAIEECHLANKFRLQVFYALAASRIVDFSANYNFFIGLKVFLCNTDGSTHHT